MSKREAYPSILDGFTSEQIAEFAVQAQAMRQNNEPILPNSLEALSLARVLRENQGFTRGNYRREAKDANPQAPKSIEVVEG